MKNLLKTLKSLLCNHDFVTIHEYDSETHKVYCFKCENKYVINRRYKWKFKLNEQSEKDYEQLRKDLNEFDTNYFNSKEGKGNQ